MAFAAAAPAQGESSLWLGLLVPLIAVTAALLAWLWWLRRGVGAGGAQGPLKIVQALAVGPRERLVVVDAQGRRLVLGVTSARIELVAELRAGEAARHDEHAVSG